MKKVISVLLAVLLLAVACVPAFAADYGVILTSDKATANVGETVNFTVRATTNIDGIKATLTYDTNCFEFVKASEGTNMGMASINSATAGKVVVAGIMKDAFVDDNTVMVVTLKVLKVDGKVSVSVSDATNAANEQVSDLIAPQSVTIAETPATTAGSNVTTTKASTATTTKKAAATTSKNSVNIPKTGGTVSVVACGAAVLAMAAAVAFTMKKKSDEE